MQLRRVLLLIVTGTVTEQGRVIFLARSAVQLGRVLLLIVTGAVAEQGWFVEFAWTVVTGHIFFLMYIYIKKVNV